MRPNTVRDGAGASQTVRETVREGTIASSGASAISNPPMFTQGVESPLRSGI